MQNQTVNNKRIAKNSLFLYTRMMFLMLIAFYTSRIVLNTLGVENYGISGVVGGIVTTISFLNGALAGSTSRFLTFALGEGNFEKLKNVFAASLNIHICVALLAFVLGETVGLWFLYEKMVIPESRFNAAFWVYQFSIVSTMFSFTQVPYSASLIAHENMSIYAYVGLAEGIIKLLISFLIKVSPIDVLIYYSFLCLLSTISIQLFYRYYTGKHYKECRFSMIKDINLYKTLLSYGGWDLIGNFSLICQGQGINILLNIFFGPVINAARSIAFQIQGVVSQFCYNFLLAVKPQIIKSYAEGNFNKMFDLAFNTAKFSFLLMLALVIPIIFEIRFVLNVWLGDNFPQETILFATIVLCTTTFKCFHIVGLMPYHAIGNIKLGNLLEGGLMIATLPISYILLKLNYPAYSVFVCIFIVEIIATLIIWMLIRKYIYYSFRTLVLKVFMPSLIILVISIIPAYFISNHLPIGWKRLIITIISTECFLCLSTFFIALNKIQRMNIIKYTRQKLFRNKLIKT